MALKKKIKTSSSDFKSELELHLKKFSTNPYLFIGSGLSRRYLNLPTWLTFLESFYSTLNLDKQFEYYQSKSNGSLPLLASIIGNEFHAKWWELPAFKNSRELYKDLAKENELSPFKIEIANNIRKHSVPNKDFEEEINLLKSSVIDGIITTNWDNFLNELFSDFKPYIGQQELMFADSFSVGELYKIHGCCSKPNSIVVTEEDYKNFNSKNAYLAAKLLTIFVEHPIIFIGYSISDKNITEFLNSIVACVDTESVKKLKDRLIFVEWSSKATKNKISDSNIVLASGSVLPIKHIEAHSFKELFEVLASLKKRLPVKILRQLRDAVYDLVKTNNSSKTKLVGDLLNNEHTEDIEFVIGVGATSFTEQGYKGITALEILEDAILENKDFDCIKLVELTIPQMIKSSVYLPVYKHLRKAKLLDEKGNIIKSYNHSEKLIEFLKTNKVETYYPSDSYARKRSEIRKKYGTVQSITSSFDKVHALYYIPLLEKENIDLKDLKKFLKDCFNDATVKKDTTFKKVVCLYDYLKYN